MCCRWRNCTRRILRVKSLETDETVPTHQEHKGKELFILKTLEYLYNIPDVGFLGVFCLGLKGFQLVFVFVKYALQVCLWSFKRVRGSHTGEEEMLGYLQLPHTQWLILGGTHESQIVHAQPADKFIMTVLVTSDRRTHNHQLPPTITLDRYTLALLSLTTFEISRNCFTLWASSS